MKFLRKADIVLILVLLLIPCAMLLYNVKTASARTGAYLLVTVDGYERGRYSLGEDQTIRIGETNVCEIRDGRVKMIHADCPDQICVYSRDIGAEGGIIVCLPNKVILEIIGGNGADDTGTDAVVQ